MFASRMICAAIAGSIVSGCASTDTRRDLRELHAMGHRLDTPAKPFFTGQAIGLDALVAVAQANSPALDHVRTEAMMARAGVDEQLAAGYPTLGVGAEFGQPTFVRAAAPGALLTLSPAINWNALRFFQAKRIAGMKLTVEEAAEARLEFERRRIGVGVARLYFLREAAHAALEQAHRDLAEAKRIDLISGEAGSGVATQDAKSALVLAQGAFDRADQALRRECKLDPLQEIASMPPQAGTPDPGSLGDYVALVLSNNVLDRAGRAQIALRDAAHSATRAERWNGFAMRSGLPNILSLLSGSPLALLGYSAELFDQGAQQRRELRTKAEAVLARVDRENGLDTLAASAMESWWRRVEAIQRHASADRKLKAAHRSMAIADARYHARAASLRDHSQARVALSKAEAELARANSDLAFANYEFDVLSQPARQAADRS